MLRSAQYKVQTESSVSSDTECTAPPLLAQEQARSLSENSFRAGKLKTTEDPSLRHAFFFGYSLPAERIVNSDDQERGDVLEMLEKVSVRLSQWALTLAIIAAQRHQRRTQCAFGAQLQSFPGRESPSGTAGSKTETELQNSGESLDQVRA